MKKHIIFIFLYWLPTILTALWVSFWGLYIFDCLVNNNPLKLITERSYQISFLVLFGILLVIVFLLTKSIGIFDDTKKITKDWLRKK